MHFATTRPGQLSFDFVRRPSAQRPGWVCRDEAIMGTAIHVELWADDRRQGETAAAAVMEEMRRVDRAMSPHKADSELSVINRNAGRRDVPLSEEMFGLIEQALAYSRLTEGAFDISYAAVGQLFDYRRRVRPSAEALRRAQAQVGWQHLHLDPDKRTLRFGKDGMRIDLGGFAKGHAVDRAAQLLRRRGISSAIVSAGGDSRVIGSHGERPWTVAVRDPRRAGEVVAVLPLEDCSVSTSGDYERYFDDVVGGVTERVHHLIDPATGRSPSHVHSVTVLADDGLTSEALSKAVFVRGARQGLALVESVPGADVVVVDAAGVLHASKGLLQGVAQAQAQAKPPAPTAR